MLRRGGDEGGPSSRNPQIFSGLSDGVLTTGEDDTSGDHPRQGEEALPGARIPANGGRCLPLGGQTTTGPSVMAMPDSRGLTPTISARGGVGARTPLHPQRSANMTGFSEPVIAPPPQMSDEKIFAAVTAELRSAPEAAQREAWKATVAALFAAEVRALKIPPDRVPPQKQRYPKLKGAEPAQLLGFFEEVSVVDGCSYVQWRTYARGICRDLYNSTWTLSTILESMTSKVKWARKPVLNQWAAKVTGLRASGQSAATGPRTEHYQMFMFNPSKYEAEEIERLRAICASSGRDRSGPRLRTGSDDEWKIIQGLAEGHIVSRGLPHFLKRIFTAKDRLRFLTTIQLQVEGELSFSLDGSITIAASRQHTQALKEDVLLAAEGLKVNLEDLHLMLSQVKTISYNTGQRTIHFFFFT